MTITFVDIEADSFMAVKPECITNLADFQIRILKEYMEDDRPPFVNHYGRKGWESSYDPKFNKGQGPRDARRVMPDVSSLPSKRWVIARDPEGSLEENLAHWIELEDWITEKKVKYQKCQVAINGEPTWVYLFKKINDALMFKLTWG